MKLHKLRMLAIPGLVCAALCLGPAWNMAQTQKAAGVKRDRGGATSSRTQEPPGRLPAERPGRMITLDAPSGLDIEANTVDSKGNLLPRTPANFQRLGEARAGQTADLHTLTLRFSQTARITGMAISKDFKIEQGGSCVEGDVYEKGSTCRVLVRFTPQGAGNRLGKLTVSSSASPVADSFGLLGNAYMPVVSFVPSVITTVPGTYPSGAGLLNGAQNLAVDVSDTLWMADTGNNMIRNIDSSGTILNLASGYTAPWGITVDTFGEAYFSRPSTIDEIYDFGTVVQLSGTGTGTGSCTDSAPCTLSEQVVDEPGELSMDSNNNMFFPEATEGAAFSTVQPSPATLVYLFDPFPFQLLPTGAMAVDSEDNLYSFWLSGVNGPSCRIIEQSFYEAVNDIHYYNNVAGGHTCGFSGDGGRAGNAEIGSWVGQIAFDAAGDLYFTDTKNQRVRRVDYNTGIIRTIAGNGTAGYAGDGYAAVNAELSSPTGVGVDSQGQVYIISSAASGQVIRKITATGYHNLGNVIKGARGPAATVLVTNTGNSSMQITTTAFTGANPGDFSVDPKTTSCELTAGASLNAGQTCQIGFILTPSALGTRNANFVILNNTVNNQNVIQLTGSGILPSATFTITSPSSGSSYASGTSVPFKVSVTSSSGSAPTGTVQFKVDGANFGSPVTISSGAASTSVTGLSVATHTLSATYSGDSNYAPGGPIIVSITVTGSVPSPVVTLVPLMSTATSCSPISFQVAVTGKPGMVPTGTVKLMNGGGELAAGSLANGKAVLTSRPLQPGTYSFIAHYSGDSHDPPAVSRALIQSVPDVGGCLPGASTR